MIQQLVIYAMMIAKAKFKLCSIIFRLMEFSAFSASVKTTGSVCSFVKISRIVCMATSAPTPWLELIYRSPAVSVMSFLKITIITFLLFSLKLFWLVAIQVFLSKGINLQAVNSSRDAIVSSFSMQSLFLIWANVLHKSVYYVPNSLEAKILRHSTALTHFTPMSHFYTT